MSTLRKIRRVIGWTQKELAEAVGTSNVVICYLENGTHNPSNKTRLKIESKLGPVNWNETKIKGKLKID